MRPLAPAELVGAGKGSRDQARDKLQPGQLVMASSGLGLLHTSPTQYLKLVQTSFAFWVCVWDMSVTADMMPLGYYQ